MHNSDGMPTNTSVRSSPPLPLPLLPTTTDPPSYLTHSKHDAQRSLHRERTNRVEEEWRSWPTQHGRQGMTDDLSPDSPPPPRHHHSHGITTHDPLCTLSINVLRKKDHQQGISIHSETPSKTFQFQTFFIFHFLPTHVFPPGFPAPPFLPILFDMSGLELTNKS